MNLIPVGIIHSPYKEKRDAPRQGRLSDCEMILEIYPAYMDCLKHIENASHLFILYWGDRANRDIHQSPTPFSKEPIGVFASRSPNRPNPIAICIVDLIHHEGNLLTVRGLDALDNSPILDIKVYSSAIDSIPHATYSQMSSKFENAPIKEAQDD